MGRYEFPWGKEFFMYIHTHTGTIVNKEVSHTQASEKYRQTIAHTHMQTGCSSIVIKERTIRTLAHTHT